MTEYRLVITADKSAVLYDGGGNEVTGKAYDGILETMREHQSSFVYLAYGKVPKQRRKAYKIGLSTKPDKRLSGLGLSTIHLIRCPYSRRIECEQRLHRYFAAQGKWIDREFVDLTPEDVSFVKSLQHIDDVMKHCVHPLLERVSQTGISRFTQLYRDMEAHKYPDYETYMRAYYFFATSVGHEFDDLPPMEDWSLELEKRLDADDTIRRARFERMQAELDLQRQKSIEARSLQLASWKKQALAAQEQSA